MILLDTHTAVWLASDQSQLSMDVKKTISLYADKLHIRRFSLGNIDALQEKKASLAN